MITLENPSNVSDCLFEKKMKTSEAKWTVIANGKSIANGTTIRRNGVVTHNVISSSKENISKAGSEESTTKEEIAEEEEVPNEINEDESSNAASFAEKYATLKVDTCSSKTSHEALTTVLRQLKWRECRGNCKSKSPADLYWHGLGHDETLYHKPGVYAVNKLPGMAEVSQKIYLSRIIRRMQMLFPGEFDFYPPTWFLPEQYHQFIGEASLKDKRKSDKKLVKRQETYIVKPNNGSQGEGIFLVNDPRDVPSSYGARPAIVQKYIDDPLLLDKFKFDLRIYVLVARLHPIEIYLCKDGLARLCTVEYESPTSSNMHNTFMHLTNYSLNKYSEDFIQTDAKHTGSKRTYQSVKEILKKQGHDVEKIHQQIVNLVVKTVLSLLPDITIWDHVANKSQLVRSFQILGFDVMLTSDLQPHLLEVNSSPSMGIDAVQETEAGSGIIESIPSAVDEQIKVPLLRDSLRLIAYGEREIDIEKSCLQRIYPQTHPTHTSPSTACNKSSPVESIKEVDKQSPTQKQTRLFDISPEIVQKLPFNIQGLSSYKENGKTVDETSTVSSIHSDVRGEGCDNSLLPHARLRSPVSFVHLKSLFPAKKPSRFTVVKYRQEYAISTEDWKFIHARHRTPTKIMYDRYVKPLNDTVNESRHVSKTSQSKFGPFENQQGTFNQNIVGETQQEICCCICGNYVDGVGTGLLYAQKEHKGLMPGKQITDDLITSESLSASRESLVHTSNFEYRRNPTRDSEWETERQILNRSSIPSRSASFNCVQKELCEYSIANALVTPRLRVPPKKDIIISPKQVCDSCAEVSSVASTTSIETIKFPNHRLLSKQSNNTSNRALKVSQSSDFTMREVMILYRAAVVFIHFNGVKRSLRINATAFRNMARRCKLCNQRSMPAIDILFLDTMRQWQQFVGEQPSPFYHQQQASGLCFQGFLDALFKIADAHFKGNVLKDKLESLVSNCELYIKEANRIDKLARRRQENRYKKKDVMSPRISCGLSQRQPYF